MADGKHAENNEEKDKEVIDFVKRNEVFIRGMSKEEYEAMVRNSTINKDTIFSAGSITKTYTAALKVEKAATECIK